MNGISMFYDLALAHYTSQFVYLYIHWSCVCPASILAVLFEFSVFQGTEGWVITVTFAGKDYQS